MIQCIINSLDKWQTLIGGLLALIAAIWTVREIRRQIALQERQIRNDETRFVDMQRRKSLGARVQLPDALSAICGYTTECLEYVADHQGGLPGPPESAIRTIKEAIEYVTPEASEKLVELLLFYQVHNSRLAHYEPGHNQIEATDRLYDTVRLRWLTERMFGYARNLDEPGQTGSIQDQMNSSLRNCVGPIKYFDHTQKWKPVVDRIAMRHPDEDLES
jgi:hypothetical protein